MAIPALDVSLAFGQAWNANPLWTDVSDYVRNVPPVRIRRGRERLSRTRPGELSLALANTDGRFDPDNASGPYYGNLNPMTPIRVRARTSQPVQWFDGPGVSGTCTGSYTTAITGDITCSARIRLDDYTSSSNQPVVAQYDVAGTRNFRFIIPTTGVLRFTWSADGTATTNIDSTVALTATDGVTDIWVRVFVDADNGAAGHSAYFYYSLDDTDDESAVSWTQLGSTVTVAGTMTRYSSTQAHTVGSSGGPGLYLAGRLYSVSVRSGGTGAATVYSPKFYDPSEWSPDDDAGDARTDGDSVTWTLGGDATIDEAGYGLFRGFLSSLTVNTRDFKDSWCDVTAADGLSVLELLKVPAGYETLVSGLSPVGWWKLDETSGTTATDSGSAGVDGTYTNTPTLNQTGPLTNMPAVDFDNASSEFVAIGSLTGASLNADWTVMAWVYPDASDTGTGLSLVAFDDNASGDTGAIGYNAGGAPGTTSFRPYGLIVRFTDTLGNTQHYALNSTLTGGTFNHVALTADASATTIRLYVNGVNTDTWTTWDTATDTGTMNVTIAKGRAGFVYADGTISQVSIHTTCLNDSQIAALANATHNGFNSESTTTRAGNILTLVGWPTGLRSLDTGISTMAALNPDGTLSALDHINQALDTEDSEAWCDGTGLFNMTDRNTRGESTLTLTLSNDGSDTPYQDLEWYRDDTLLRTVAQVTDQNGDTVEAIHGNAATYGSRTIQQTTLTTDTTEPLYLAQWLANEYATPLTHATAQLRAAASTTAAIWTEILSREISDLALVEVKPVGTTAQQTWHMFVESITLTANTDLWILTLGLSNATGQGSFVFNNAVFGTFDGPGRLGF